MSHSSETVCLTNTAVTQRKPEHRRAPRSSRSNERGHFRRKSPILNKISNSWHYSCFTVNLINKVGAVVTFEYSWDDAQLRSDGCVPSCVERQKIRTSPRGSDSRTPQDATNGWEPATADPKCLGQCVSNRSSRVVRRRPNTRRRR